MDALAAVPRVDLRSSRSIPTCGGSIKGITPFIDYIGLVADATTAYAVWMDNRDYSPTANAAEDADPTTDPPSLINARSLDANVYFDSSEMPTSDSARPSSATVSVLLGRREQIRILRLLQAEVRSQKTNPSRSTISPRSQAIGSARIGPAETKVWNSPFSPQGSTPGGSSASSRSS